MDGGVGAHRLAWCRGAQKPGGFGQSLQGGQDVVVIADQELFRRVGTPANQRHSDGKDAAQPGLNGAVGRNLDAEPPAHSLEEGDHQQ